MEAAASEAPEALAGGAVPPRRPRCEERLAARADGHGHVAGGRDELRRAAQQLEAVPRVLREAQPGVHHERFARRGPRPGPATPRPPTRAARPRRRRRSASSGYGAEAAPSPPASRARASARAPPRCAAATRASSGVAQARHVVHGAGARVEAGRRHLGAGRVDRHARAAARPRTARPRGPGRAARARGPAAAPGRVDSPPTSTRSAPSASSSSTRARAASAPR